MSIIKDYIKRVIKEERYLTESLSTLLNSDLKRNISMVEVDSRKSHKELLMKIEQLEDKLFISENPFKFNVGDKVVCKRLIKSSFPSLGIMIDIGGSHKEIGIITGRRRITPNDKEGKKSSGIYYDVFIDNYAVCEFHQLELSHPEPVKEPKKAKKTTKNHKK